jgi:hypothetical protein
VRVAQALPRHRAVSRASLWRRLSPHQLDGDELTRPTPRVTLGGLTARRVSRVAPTFTTHGTQNEERAASAVAMRCDSHRSPAARGPFKAYGGGRRGAGRLLRQQATESVRQRGQPLERDSHRGHLRNGSRWNRQTKLTHGPQPLSTTERIIQERPLLRSLYARAQTHAEGCVTGSPMVASSGSHVVA